jgi:hypothetical protein
MRPWCVTSGWIRGAAWRRLAGSLGLAGVLVLVGMPASAGGSAAHGRTGLVQEGPVTVLGDCAPGSVYARATIPRRTFTASQPVTVRAVLHQVRGGTCDVAMSGGPATIGPCGVMGMKILNSAGVDVWPGLAAFNCPMLQAKLLVGVLKATGTWNQFPVDSASAAPRGDYRLIVGGRLAFRITLR